MDFSQVIGHEKNIDILKQAIKNKTISHSYLFEGAEGIGKKRVAYAFSKTLLCLKGGLEACNSCASCLKFERYSHPDFFIIEPEKEIIRIKQIEGLIEEMSTAPFESGRKVFIIDDSHKMNKESENALLKTLEEPPGFVIIILITSKPDSLLTTILSRVQTIKFFPLKVDKIANLLIDKYKKSEDEAYYIAEFSKGALGKSIRLAEDMDFFQRREEVLALIAALLKGDKSKIFSSTNFFKDNREHIDEILDIFTYWFRDLIIYKETRRKDFLINRDKVEDLSKQANMNLDKINDIINSIMETRTNINRNINYQLAIENMLLNI